VKAPRLESVFLNRAPRPETRDFSRVLVLGDGETGLELSLRLAGEGFEVLLVGDAEDDHAGDACPRHGSTVLEEVHGFIGGFDVTLKRGAERSTEQVGFIVAAPPVERIPKYEAYGLSRSKRVMALSDLDALLEADESLAEPRGEWFHAVFLCGLKRGADPDLFARVFDSIDRLRQTVPLQAYVFTRQVKVAAPGLEARYRQAREDGTQFFKFDRAGPIFEQDPDGLTMIFTDPILRIELELVPDLLVVDEDQRPASSLKPLLDLIPSTPVTAPFLQPESTRFTGVGTPKAGILALGASRGDFSRGAATRDVDTAIAALKTLEHEETPPGLPDAPTVDQAKCTICLTCVRLCPHAAMSFGKRAEADPASCVRCGICAAECPMDAIRLAPPQGEAEITEKIVQGLAQSDRPQKIMAFLCSKSAAQAMESVAAGIRENLTPIIVPCAGTIDPTHILDAFQSRADGVLVAGCHTGNCASIYGTVLAAGRVSRTALLLQEAGIDPNRLTFTTLASNTPGDFSRAVSALEEKIGKSAHAGTPDQ